MSAPSISDLIASPLLLFFERGLFYDSVVLVAAAKVLVFGQDPAHRHDVTDIGRFVRGADEVMVLLGLAAGSVLDMNPVFTHNSGRNLDHLAFDYDFLLVQFGAFGKYLLNSICICAGSLGYGYFCILSRSSRLAASG